MRMRDLRNDIEKTQVEVSKDLGVSRGSYSLWESETEPIPIRRLNDICNYFDVSIDYMLEFTYVLNYNYVNRNLNIHKIAERLTEIRKENHHTQNDIARQFQLDRSLISKYEKGVALISTTFLIEYAKFYHISCDYLLGRIDEKITINEFSNN